MKYHRSRPRAGQPGERPEHTRNARPNDGRLSADRQDVRADRRDRPELGDKSGETEQPGCTEHAGGDERDILARNGEQVVQARGAKAVAKRLRHLAVVSEHDADEYLSALARRSRRERSGQPRVQAVGDATEATPASDGTPPVDPQDDMHPMAPEIPSLVEAMLGGARRLDLRQHIEAGTLGRRASESQLEQHRLSDRATLEAERSCRSPDRETFAARGCSDLDEHPTRAADVDAQRAAVDRLEPERAPGTTGEARCDANEQEACRRARSRCSDDEENDHERWERSGEAKRIGGRESRAQRAGGNVQGSAIEAPHRQSTTRSRSSSRRFGPIPGTASSSSTDLKAPCAVR